MKSLGDKQERISGAKKEKQKSIAKSQKKKKKNFTLRSFWIGSNN